VFREIQTRKSYLDRKLALTDKLVYRVTAVDSQGNESSASAETGEY
jgi:hypothetical protein